MRFQLPKSKAFKGGRTCLIDMADSGCFEGRVWSFEEGLKFNPFRKGTRKYKQWHQGFREACQEAYHTEVGGV